MGSVEGTFSISGCPDSVPTDFVGSTDGYSVKAMEKKRVR